MRAPGRERRSCSPAVLAAAACGRNPILGDWEIDRGETPRGAVLAVEPRSSATLSLRGRRHRRPRGRRDPRERRRRGRGRARRPRRTAAASTASSCSPTASAGRAPDRRHGRLPPRRLVAAASEEHFACESAITRARRAVARPRPARPAAGRRRVRRARPAALLERRPAEAGDRRLRRAGDEGGRPGLRAAAERIAVFDNDGTLWSEQPMYVQLAFALDRVKTLAPEHPEWKTTEPFAARPPRRPRGRRAERGEGAPRARPGDPHGQ